IYGGLMEEPRQAYQKT
ncbi:unnamed protein product, partial [Allacma fusca]